jgi:hypothetical protein
MLIEEKLFNKITDQIDKRDKKLKKGFWAGLLSFFIAKITHILVVFSMSLWLSTVFIRPNGTYSPNFMKIIGILDNSLVGYIYLIIITRMIYTRITK